METLVIRKRLNTFKSGAGKLTRVSDDVVMEVLRGWESCPGTGMVGAAGLEPATPAV